MGSLKNVAVLVVEDDPLFSRRLTGFLEKAGADVTRAQSLTEARNLQEDLSFDAVLLDVNLPDGYGTDLLREGAFSGNTAVVVMTAEERVASAVEAMRLGAADYLAKPFDLEELPIILQRARGSKRSQRIESFRKERDAREGAAIYFGPTLSAVKEQMDKIVAADRKLVRNPPPVLVEGETGTGKTSFARWLHYNGPRSEGPLVELNCATLSETLAESELFGHERGAFTDARQERIGLFEAARDGTLFLDEIPSLSPALQAKVLTAIEDRIIRRLGGNRTIEVDVRLIAATNCDLQEKVAAGEFREDLYHRLNLCRLTIPPLRERLEDLPDLAGCLLERLAERYGSRLPKLHADATQRLKAYSWPGNVRELAHVLERAFIFEDGDRLRLDQLSTGISPATASANQDPAGWLNPNFSFPESGFSLEEAINLMIQKALKQTDGNVSAAARLLGVSRDYIRYRLDGKTKDSG